MNRACLIQPVKVAAWGTAGVLVLCDAALALFALWAFAWSLLIFSTDLGHLWVWFSLEVALCGAYLWFLSSSARLAIDERERWNHPGNALMCALQGFGVTGVVAVAAVLIDVLSLGLRGALY
jgi:hypothetical protein